MPRTRKDVDTRLRNALQPGQLVVVVGLSKTGKTRTAFEAARARWPQARLLAPTPAGLGRLVTHPRVAGNGDPLVVWLDDLHLFLKTDPLTPALLAMLTARPAQLPPRMSRGMRGRLVKVRMPKNPPATPKACGRENNCRKNSAGKLVS